MKYLVLGSNSFSGGSFISYLLREEPEATVFAVSRSLEYHSTLLAYKNVSSQKKVVFYQYDLNKDLDKIVSLIENEKIPYIVNFAAQGMVSQSWEAPLEWFETNTLSLVALIDKIYKFSFIKKFVQASTPEVYGVVKGAKESMCFSPTSPYAVSKASADLALFSYFKTHKFPVCYTRSANVYGRYQQLYRIIPKTILMIKKSQKLQLHGGGRAIRSFVHINDVSRATLKILHDAPSGEIYHISDTKTISIRDLVDLICKEMNVAFDDVVEIVNSRVSEDSVYLMDASKLEEEMSLSPQVDFKDAIRDVIEWIEKDFETLATFPDVYRHKK